MYSRAVDTDAIEYSISAQLNFRLMLLKGQEQWSNLNQDSA
jgi:hypothetical protein